MEAKPKCPPWVNTLIIYRKGVYILWFERVRALSQKGVYKAFAVIFPNNAFQSSLGAFCERLYRHQDIFPQKRNKSNKIILSGRKHWCKIKNFILLRVDLFFSFAFDHALSLYLCNLLFFFPLEPKKQRSKKKKITPDLRLFFRQCLKLWESYLSRKPITSPKGLRKLLLTWRVKTKMTFISVALFVTIVGGQSGLLSGSTFWVFMNS